MKTSWHRAFFRHTVAIVAAGLLSGAGAHAAIIGINTPVTSVASINFDDTNSFNPGAGITNSGPVMSPWSGAPVSLPLTTDPSTFDFAQGDIDATFIPFSNTYALNFNNIMLNQTVTSTGYADLDFNFNVEFQLDAAGLPAQGTLYPNFMVSGTVQNLPGSFAHISGFIDYIGVNTAGVSTVVETVNYNDTWTTPGPFIATAVGVPVNGTTPALGPNSTLTLNGFIRFRVDPADINAFSQMAPEPSRALLAVLGIGAALARRTREK